MVNESVTLVSPGTSQLFTRPRGYSPGNVGLAGLHFLKELLANAHFIDSAKWFVLGSLLEVGRRLCKWLYDRFYFRYSTSAHFIEGDPSYEWIVLWLTKRDIWQETGEFEVTAKSSLRKWDIEFDGAKPGGSNIDLVPTYGKPQLFRYNGHWVEITKNASRVLSSKYHDMFGSGPRSASSITLTVYTLSLDVLSSLIEQARLDYIESGKSNIIVHTADPHTYGPGGSWGSVKRKHRRPLSSVILDDGVVESLISDSIDFLRSEAWYMKTGVPHRRGFLLSGPPGSGKSSTIYAMAGELNLEIYSLSLSSGFVDDAYLQRAASAVPKNSILLLEDIDCALSREENHTDEQPAMTRGMFGHTVPVASKVTLSGLLNVIDGVGSEEGRLFIATTNYIDRLDPALVRPGRIDRTVHYKLASRRQAKALFLHFFPATESYALKETTIETLADEFANGIPETEFSTAELQGYLLLNKHSPAQVVDGLSLFVEREREQRRAKAERERLCGEKKEAAVKQALAAMNAPNSGAGPMHGRPFDAMSGPLSGMTGGAPSEGGMPGPSIVNLPGMEALKEVAAAEPNEQKTN